MSFEALLVFAIILILDITYQLLFVRKPPTTKRRTYGNQFIQKVQERIDEEISLFGQSIKVRESPRIPDTRDIPIVDKRWDKIPGVICCFVDMKGSTKLSVKLENDEDLAKSYRLFTETAIRIFHIFESPYIDVKGDGVFALFNSDQPHTALAATISFKTFVYEYFTPKIEGISQQKIEGHFGIDQADVLVRKFGLKKYRDRTDRQNEVWAGQPVNIAAKLASLSEGNELLVSPKFFKNLYLKDFDSILQWSPENKLLDERFSFDFAHVLYSNWSKLDGELHCRKLMSLDKRWRIKFFPLSEYWLVNFWRQKFK